MPDKNHSLSGLQKRLCCHNRSIVHSLKGFRVRGKESHMAQQHSRCSEGRAPLPGAPWLHASSLPHSCSSHSPARELSAFPLPLPAPPRVQPALLRSRADLLVPGLQSGQITGWVSARGHSCLTHCRRSVPTYVCCKYTQLNKLHPGSQAPKSPSPTLHFHVHCSKFCSTTNEVIVWFSLKKSIYWNCLNTLYKFPIQASAPWLRVNANTKAQTSAAP